MFLVEIVGMVVRKQKYRELKNCGGMGSVSGNCKDDFLNK